MLPGIALGVIMGAVANALPLFEKTFHLQVVEDSLAEGVDAAQQRERAIFAGRDDSVEQNPFTAFSEIIFQLHDNRHGRPTLIDNLAAGCGLFQTLWYCTPDCAALE